MREDLLLFLILASWYMGGGGREERKNGRLKATTMVSFLGQTDRRRRRPLAPRRSKEGAAANNRVAEKKTGPSFLFNLGRYKRGTGDGGKASLPQLLCCAVHKGAPKKPALTSCTASDPPLGICSCFLPFWKYAPRSPFPFRTR